MEHKHYVRLAVMTVASFAAMYGLMYAMVNSIANIYSNFNQLYMAGLMTAAMVVIELIVMRSMYHNAKVNVAILLLGFASFLGCWTFIRQQTAIADEQFLRSMIPHHAGAILMCERAAIRDQAVRDLCKEIISSQQKEIEQMKHKLYQLNH